MGKDGCKVKVRMGPYRGDATSLCLRADNGNIVTAGYKGKNIATPNMTVL